MYRVTAPYPSTFHRSSLTKRPFIWETKSDRHYLAAFVGNTETTNLLATMLRRYLKTYCYFHPKCKIASYSKDHDSGSIEDETPDPHFQFYFCPLSTSAMYTHHWPAELWKKIVVEIDVNIEPMNYIRRVLQLMGGRYWEIIRCSLVYLDQLAKPPKEIARRQKLIKEHAFELHYGLTGYEKGSSWPMNAHGAPVHDAYEKTMDLVLRVHSGEENLLTNVPKVDESLLTTWRN